jgi:GR25 family glycosyltransferase involved in LPS biosynthesis
MNKLEGFPTIYCASLEESTDRRKTLNEQFLEYNLTPTYLISKRYNECTDIIAGLNINSIDDKVKGCAVSHLKMIKEWYDNTNEEYGFFCEDDLSLETVKYWDFTFQEFIKTFPSDWEAIQLCVIRDQFEDISLRKRQLDDWSVTAYILKREYAKKIIEHYMISLKDILENLPQYLETIPIYRLEVNKWSQIQPLVEHIILLNTGITYCFPLFVENINGPTTSSDTQALNHLYSYDFIINWWKNK